MVMFYSHIYIYEDNHLYSILLQCFGQARDKAEALWKKGPKKGHILWHLADRSMIYAIVQEAREGHTCGSLG